VPRQPKPYVHQGWYCTSTGGVQHRKLCPVEAGAQQAEIALARLVVAIEDAKRGLTGPADTTVGRPDAVIKQAPGPALSPTVADIHDQFLEVKRVECEPDTYHWYRDKLNSFFERFANHRLTAITYEEGLKYKEWLRKEKRWVRGKEEHFGLGNSSVNAHLRAAKTLLEWASKPSRRHQTGLSFNPWEEIKYLVEKPRERLITAEEFGHLIAQCKDGSVAGGRADFREMLTVLRYTTMRPGELRKLRWEYVQWPENRIVFPPQVIKTKRRREVVMIDLVKQSLENRKQRAVEKGLLLKGYVFPLPVKREGTTTAVEAGDRPQKANSFAQRFRRLFQRCVKLELIEKEKDGETIVLYSTRHSRITELSTQGHEQEKQRMADAAKAEMPGENPEATPGTDEAEALRLQLLAEAGKVGPGQLDALLDRAYLADSFFEEHVLQDPACLHSPELFRAAWAVAQALAGFYQRVGQEVGKEPAAGATAGNTAAANP
jgi:integrase